MRRLILPCSILLAAGSCPGRDNYVTVRTVVPPALTEPVVKPDRPLVTYKDAVVRDAERGAAIDQANAQLAAIRKIVGPQ